MTKATPHNCQAMIITAANGEHMVDIAIKNGKLVFETTPEKWEADLIAQPPDDDFEREVLRLAEAAGMRIWTLREPEWNE